MKALCVPRASLDGRRWSRLGALWFTLAGAEIGGQALRGIVHTDHGDLPAFLTGARLVGSDPGCLYCPTAQAAAQTAVLGHPSDIGINPYVNPPLAAWVLQPLARLPVGAAMAVFTVISLAALAAAALVLSRVLPPEWPRSRRAAVGVITAVVLPAGSVLALGQWSLLLLLAAAGAAVLIRHGDRIEAGLLIGVLLLKPQLVWLVVPALVVAGAWRSLAGFAMAAAAWLGTGLLIAGPRFPADLVHIVRGSQVGEAYKTAGLPGFAASAGLSGSAAVALSAVLAGGAVALSWALRGRLRRDLPLALGLGLALSALCSPHVFSGDLVLLAVPLTLLAARVPVPAMAASVALGVAWLVDQQFGGDPARMESLVAIGVTAWLVATIAERRPGRARIGAVPAVLTRL